MPGGPYGRVLCLLGSLSLTTVAIPTISFVLKSTVLTILCCENATLGTAPEKTSTGYSPYATWSRQTPRANEFIGYVLDIAGKGVSWVAFPFRDRVTVQWTPPCTTLQLSGFTASDQGTYLCEVFEDGESVISAIGVHTQELASRQVERPSAEVEQDPLKPTPFPYHAPPLSAQKVSHSNSGTATLAVVLCLLLVLLAGVGVVVYLGRRAFDEIIRRTRHAATA